MLIYLSFFSGGILLLLVLPRPYTGLIFAGLVALSFGIALISGAMNVLPSQWRVIQPIRQRILAVFAANRAGLAQAAACAAVCAIVVSAWLFRPAPDEALLPDALLFLFVGGLALGAALSLSRVSTGAVIPLHAQISRLQIRVKPLAFGVLALALLTEINAQIIGVVPLASISHHLQFILFVLGIMLVVVGLGGATFPRRFPAIRWRSTLLALAIVAAAVIIRAWALNDSLRVFVDEIHFTDVMRLFYAPDNPVQLLHPMSEIAPFSRLFAYGQAMTSLWLGRDFAGLRAFSVPLGALQVLALYALAKELFDRKTGFLAALLLAAFPPHIHFSRLGQNMIADPLFGLLALLFLTRALKHGRQIDYALAGGMLGLTQYFYEAGKLLIPALVISWLVGGWLVARVRPSLRGVMVMFAAATLVAAPLYWTVQGSAGLAFSSRFRDAGLAPDYFADMVREGNFHLYLRRLADAFLVYIHTPEIGLLYYGGATPLLLSVVVPLFLLGVFYALWRVRSFGMLLPLLWVLGAGFGSSLMLQSTVYARYVIVLPALSLLAAIGLRYALPLVWPLSFDRRFQFPVMLALALSLGVFQINYYFGAHLTYLDRQTRPVTDFYDAVLRSRDFPPGTIIHFIGNPKVDDRFARGILAYFVPRICLDTDDPAPDQFCLYSHAPEDITPAYLHEYFPRNRPHAFFIAPADAAVVGRLRRVFYLRPPVFSPYDVPVDKQFVLYFAPVIPGYTGEANHP
jgi:hypothetical protein